MSSSSQQTGVPASLSGDPVLLEPEDTVALQAAAAEIATKSRRRAGT